MELRKIHFGDSGVEGCNDQRFSLLCTSNHFGFTFVGCKTGECTCTIIDNVQNVLLQNVSLDLYLNEGLISDVSHFR